MKQRRSEAPKNLAWIRLLWTLQTPSRRLISHTAKTGWNAKRLARLRHLSTLQTSVRHRQSLEKGRGETTENCQGFALCGRHRVLCDLRHALARIRGDAPKGLASLRMSRRLFRLLRCTEHLIKGEGKLRKEITHPRQHVVQRWPGDSQKSYCTLRPNSKLRMRQCERPNACARTHTYAWKISWLTQGIRVGQTTQVLTHGRNRWSQKYTGEAYV